MSKTEKELAYLHGLYVENEWIPKFTDIFDESYEASKEDTFIYFNAGAGSHALSLREKLHEDTQLFAVCETSELQKLAQAKAETIKADVDFSTSKPYFKSDFLLLDSSLVKPSELDSFLTEAVHLSKKHVAFFVLTAGSFGEIFSYMWEIFTDSELSEKVPEIENLINSLPTSSHAEETAKKLGLINVSAKTKNEFLEFKNGKAFMQSPLVEYFLSPIWFDFLRAKEKEQVIKKLTQKIDDDLGKLSFHVSIKATVIYGEKG